MLGVGTLLLYTPQWTLKEPQVCYFQIAKVLSVSCHNEVLLYHTTLEHIHKLSHTASTQLSEATGQLLAFGYSWHSAEHMES